jgi:hypothetical protein
MFFHLGEEDGNLLEEAERDLRGSPSRTAAISIRALAEFW